MKKTLYLFAVLLLLVGCWNPAYTPPPQEHGTAPVVLAGGEGVELLAEGVATISGSADISRDQALKDALRKAVEQGVGSFVNSETRVQNFQLLSDRIYSQANGYVSSYRVINESREADLYRVTIRAKVKNEKLAEDLRAIGILLAEQARPRLMVIVKEVPEGAAIRIPDITMGEEVVETMLVGKFQEKGFPVVDRATVARNLDRERLKKILEGDEQAAMLVGLGSGAEIGVVGTMSRTSLRKRLGYSNDEVNFYRVRLNLKAINSNTSEVLAATTILTELPFREDQALQRAVDSASTVLISRILAGWQRRLNITQVRAESASYNRVERFKTEVLTKVRGVISVITRELSGTSALIEIVSETPSQDVFRELGGGKLQIPFQVQGFSGNRMEIRFITPEEKN